MNNDHKKKMVAPVLITIFFIVYLIAYAVTIIKSAGWQPIMILFTIPLIALGIGMIFTLKSRIKEIRSGEEDDLKYY